MNGRYVFLTGPCKWAMLDQMDDKYRCYKIDLYLDKENLVKFKESGMSLQIKEDEEGSYVTFRRKIDNLLDGMPEKPKKLIREDDKYLPFDELVGNGSIVTVKIQTYPLKRMSGIGHRLEAVAVEQLVPYAGEAGGDDLPF